MKKVFTIAFIGITLFTGFTATAAAIPNDHGDVACKDKDDDGEKGQYAPSSAKIHPAGFERGEPPMRK